MPPTMREAEALTLTTGGSVREGVNKKVVKFVVSLPLCLILHLRIGLTNS